LGTSNESSTGIGLYLCPILLRKIKDMAFSEGQNKGAVFTISFKEWVKE
jgi:two-component sensor histidine kinase